MGNKDGKESKMHGHVHDLPGLILCEGGVHGAHELQEGAVHALKHQVEPVAVAEHGEASHDIGVLKRPCALEKVFIVCV